MCLTELYRGVKVVILAKAKPVPLEWEIIYMSGELTTTATEWPKPCLGITPTNNPPCTTVTTRPPGHGKRSQVALTWAQLMCWPPSHQVMASSRIPGESKLIFWLREVSSLSMRTIY